MTLQTGVVASHVLPWRHNTPLHEEIGARVIRITPIIVGAGGSATLFNAPFHAGTIDRIIGVRLRAAGVVAAGTMTIADIASGFSWSIVAGTRFGNYDFNIETLSDLANIVFTSSVALTEAENVQVSLLNFEIPSVAIGGV